MNPRESVYPILKMDCIVAEIVAHESSVVYDIPHNELKHWTVEELYEKLGDELAKKICYKVFPGATLLHNCDEIFSCLSELYRKGIQWPPDLDWWNYDVVRCAGNPSPHCPPYLDDYETHVRGEKTYLKRILKPDEIRNHGSHCIHCGSMSTMIDQELIPIAHEQMVSHQLREKLADLRPFVKRELEKIRKIKALQIKTMK